MPSSENRSSSSGITLAFRKRYSFSLTASMMTVAFANPGRIILTFAVSDSNQLTHSIFLHLPVSQQEWEMEQVGFSHHEPSFEHLHCSAKSLGSRPPERAQPHAAAWSCRRFPPCDARFPALSADTGLGSCGVCANRSLGWQTGDMAPILERIGVSSVGRFELRQHFDENRCRLFPADACRGDARIGATG
jgi:hypothetical protein